LRLKKLIKKFVDAHIVKKADIFTYEEVKKALLELYDSNKPKELQFKIGKWKKFNTKKSNMESSYNFILFWFIA